jgi:hypothetical protein
MDDVEVGSNLIGPLGVELPPGPVSRSDLERLGFRHQVLCWACDERQENLETVWQQ